MIKKPGRPLDRADDACRTGGPPLDDESHLHPAPLDPERNVSDEHGFLGVVEQGKLEADLDLAAITYVTGRDTVIPSGRIVGMAHWREVLFSIVDRNSTRGAVYFAIPANQVIEIGTEIEI